VSNGVSNGWARIGRWLGVKQAAVPVEGQTEPGMDELLWQAKREVEAATRYFHSVSDPALVDHACYLLEAAEKRYSYLLRLARSEHGKMAV